MENSGAWLNIHLCQFWCFMSHSSLMQRFFFCWDWMEVCVLRKWLCAEKPRTLEKAQRQAAALSAVEERKLWVCEWNQDPFRNPFSLPLDFSISPYSNLISFQLYNFFIHSSDKYSTENFELDLAFISIMKSHYVKSYKGKDKCDGWSQQGF